MKSRDYPTYKILEEVDQLLASKPWWTPLDWSFLKHGAFTYDKNQKKNAARRRRRSTTL